MGACMNEVNKTLYIPLYGKAFVSKKGLFLADKKAEEIWAAEGFALKGKSKSKWLAYYMGIRAATFDEWVKERLAENQDATVLHIGCGLDSRVLRVGAADCKWYDVDFADVIEERKRYYTQSANYKMLAADVREKGWLDAVAESKHAVVVMEGISMYLNGQELQGLLDDLCAHFETVALLMDCYTVFGAKMSKKANPINDVGVSTVYGIDKPESFATERLVFVKEHEMIPQKYVEQLTGLEKFIFVKVYAGGFSKKLYRKYEYRKA